MRHLCLRGIYAIRKSSKSKKLSFHLTVTEIGDRMHSRVAKQISLLRKLLL